MAGDSESRAVLVQRLQSVRRILSSLSRRRGDAVQDAELDDVAQEVRMSILQKLASFRGDAALETWIYSFCSLALMNHRRASRRRRAETLSTEHETADALVDHADPSRQDESEFARLLRHLSARERDIVELKFLSQMTLNEIATTLEVSASTVKTCYYRAMDKLRALHQESGNQTGRGRT